MGLTKEIEQIYRSTLELDLDRISRTALATSHWSKTPPCSLCRFDRPTTGHSMKLQGQDYQIVRIELDPLEMHADTRMPKIKHRRAFRNVNSEFEILVGDGHFHEAYHEFIEESHALGPISIVPRLLDEGAVDNELPTIIAVAGINYIREDYLANIKDQHEYDTKIKAHLESCSDANVDLWPEEVVLRHPDYPDDNTKNNQKVVYVRFDVKYWEENDPKDRRFGA